MAHGYLSSSAARGLRKQSSKSCYKPRISSSERRRQCLVRVLDQLLYSHPLGAYERISVNRAVLVDCLDMLAGYSQPTQGVTP
jgi:hypothetical protein